jgi:hypothetical protein
MWTCGPVHIQFNNSSAYSGLNIQQKVSALVLEISRQFNARYTANWMPNIAHIPQFTLWELWPRTYTMYLHLRIFRLQYATERICAAIDDISTFQCAIYCKLVAKYSAHPPVYAMWTVVPDIYNTFTASHIQTSMFIWTCLRCYRKYLDNSMLVILQPWCQIQPTSSSLSYVICGPGHIQWNDNTAYSDFNVHLIVSALLLEISGQFNSRYNANLVPNTTHILQFTLCDLWSRTYAMQL